MWTAGRNLDNLITLEMDMIHVDTMQMRTVPWNTMKIPTWQCSFEHDATRLHIIHLDIANAQHLINMNIYMNILHGLFSQLSTQSEI